MEQQNNEVEEFKRKLSMSQLKQVLREEKRHGKFDSAYQIQKFLDLMREAKRMRKQERRW